MIWCPLVSRTLATLRMAELGFLGVGVMTCRQTPRRNGEFCKAGDFDLYRILLRPLRTSWLMVGMLRLLFTSASQVLGNGARIISRGILRCNKYFDAFRLGSETLRADFNPLTSHGLKQAT